MKKYDFIIDKINYSKGIFKRGEVICCFQIDGYSARGVEKAVNYGKRKKLFSFSISNDFSNACIRKG